MSTLAPSTCGERDAMICTSTGLILLCSWMGSQRFVVGFIQRALAGPNYNCEISMRIVESDKEAMKERSFGEAEANTKLLLPHGNEDLDQDLSESIEADAAHEDIGMPSLRFGTINDPLPASPDASKLSGSRSTGWTTVNAPLANMYAGLSTYLSRDLCHFPIANSDGTVVLSILPVVSSLGLLSFMDGAENGKHYDKPNHEYYKVEAVGHAARRCATSTDFRCV